MELQEKNMYIFLIQLVNLWKNFKCKRTFPSAPDNRQIDRQVLTTRNIVALKSSLNEDVIIARVKHAACAAP